MAVHMGAFADTGFGFLVLGSGFLVMVIGSGLTVSCLLELHIGWAPYLLCYKSKRVGIWVCAWGVGGTGCRCLWILEFAPFFSLGS